MTLTKLKWWIIWINNWICAKFWLKLLIIFNYLISRLINYLIWYNKLSIFYSTFVTLRKRIFFSIKVIRDTKVAQPLYNTLTVLDIQKMNLPGRSISFDFNRLLVFILNNFEYFWIIYWMTMNWQLKKLREIPTTTYL